MKNVDARLDKLARVWPREPCPDCERRPAVVCVTDEDEPAPCYPEGPCPVCGRMRSTVPVLVGIDCDRL
jgi:hypothetical protein